MRWTLLVLVVAAQLGYAKEYHYASSGKLIPFEVLDGLAAVRDPRVHRRHDVWGKMGFRLVERKATHQFVPVRFPTTGGMGVLTPRVLVGASLEELKALPPNKWIVRVEALTPKISLIHTTSVEAAAVLGPELTKLNSVRFAHPAFHFPIEARNTYDPLVGEQWHLRNSGQRGGTPGSDIRALDAWEISRGGPDTLVALIDLGFEQDHPDLNDVWYRNEAEVAGNKIDDDENGFVDDVRGWNFDIASNNLLYGSANSHGTATAGLLAARENGIGITGVCPECRVLPMVIYTDIVDAIAAFQYAAEHGARVVSNSWGYRVGTPTTQALEEVLGELSQQMSILFAMPNFGSDACRGGSPDISSTPGVVAISSVDYHDRKVEEAGFGACLQLVGPTAGSQINALVTTDRVGERGYNRAGASYPDLNDRNYTQAFYGTSAATPVVAGVFALLYAQHPDWSPAQVVAQVIATADKISPVHAAYDENGHSQRYGYGRPNAYRALTE